MEKIKMPEGKSLLWGRGYVSLTETYSEDGEIILNVDKLNEDFCPIRIKNVGQAIISDFKDRDADLDDLFATICSENEGIEIDLYKLSEFTGLMLDIETKDIKSVSLFPYVENGKLLGYDYDMSFEYDLRQAVGKYNNYVELLKEATEQDIER